LDFKRLVNTLCAIALRIAVQYLLQERTFFVDYIKNHNALMMKDIYELRSSIMRRNAYLVDWLVDNCGASQLQMVHRKPLASTLNPPGITPSPMPVDRGDTCSRRFFLANNYTQIIIVVCLFIFFS